MKRISQFINLKENDLSETEKILEENNLVIHHAVSKIVLMGSRGIQGGFRHDSDADLGLVLKESVFPAEEHCREILELTLSSWKGGIELDIALVFDKLNCGLLCYERQHYDPNICPYGKDCIGLYKIQKGFSGFVPEMGLEVKNIYPILVIWQDSDT